MKSNNDNWICLVLQWTDEFDNEFVNVAKN